jgi:hypothetical protein
MAEKPFPVPLIHPIQLAEGNFLAKIPWKMAV